MCFGLDILGLNSGTKAAAAATEEAARQSRLVAAGAQQATEATIAQSKATDAAKALLSTPAETTTVNIGDQAPTAAIDPVTGLRRTVRSTFQLGAGAASSGSGLSI